MSEAFSDGQIALMETFADQAAIAIENARLPPSCRPRTPTSPTPWNSRRHERDPPRHLQLAHRRPPVFNTIVRSALKLCNGFFTIVYGFDGEIMTVLADHQVDPRASAALRSLYPAQARVIISSAAPARPPRVPRRGRPADPSWGEPQYVHGHVPFRTALAVPMLRDGTPIGAIAVGRADRRPFSDTQIDLLQIFADQASSRSRTSACLRAGGAQ